MTDLETTQNKVAKDDKDSKTTSEKTRIKDIDFDEVEEEFEENKEGEIEEEKKLDGFEEEYDEVEEADVTDSEEEIHKLEEKVLLETKKKIDFNSKEHPLNLVFNRPLRNIYILFENYTVENHNDWI